jgi:small subunit ribosomal protein S16
MPAKIRLQRFGKKGKPFYHIVIADGRAPRDGKFIEKIGTYNPTTNPATIQLDTDKAMSWLENGAQPTDTCRSILSYKGVMYKKHLSGGVKKGALTQEQADAKFEKWVAEKEAKITGKEDKLSADKKAAYDKRFNAESKVKDAKAAKVLAKTSELADAAEAAAATAEATVAEEKKEETPAAEGETPAKA